MKKRILSHAKRALGVALAVLMTAGLIVPVAGAFEWLTYPSGVIHAKRVLDDGRLFESLFYNMQNGEILRMEDIYPDIVNILNTSDVRAVIYIDNGSGTVIGQLGKFYEDIAIIDAGSTGKGLIDLNIIDLHIDGINEVRNLNVTGICRTSGVGSQNIADETLVIDGTGTLIVEPRGIYSANNLEININVTVKSAAHAIFLHGDLLVSSHLTAHGGEGEDHLPLRRGAALFLSRGKVIFTNSNARVDLHPDPVAVKNDIRFTKADGVHGAWNVSPRSAIVSGKTTDNEIVIDVGSGSVSVWLGEPMPDLPEINLDTASHWSHSHITAAIGKGFVPSDIQGNYTDTITRAEFCRMAVKWVEYATGKNIDAILTEKGLTRDLNAFTDTSDPDILAAFALDITSGVGGGRFDPNGEFNREQAATMIMNTVRAIGADVTAPASTFADIGTAAGWALPGISFVQEHGIMSGTGANNFSPKNLYTREMSIVTFNNIKHNELPGR
jgi:hypothetical protein